MDIKRIIASPAELLKSVEGVEGDIKVKEIRSLITEIAVVKEEIKRLKKSKGEVSGKFKKTAEGSEAYALLVSEMQTVSQLLRSQEECYKQLEKRLIRVVENVFSTNAALPPIQKIEEGCSFGDLYRIRELAINEWDIWFSYVGSRHTSAYHQRPWPKVIEQSFGHPTRIWVAEAVDGTVLGGVPLVFFNTKLFGKFAVSIPYFNYGGVVSSWINVARDLLTHLRQVGAEEGLSYIEVRTMQANLHHNVSTKKVSMILNLPSTNEELEERLGAKVRAQYKKAEENFPEIRFGKEDLLEDFYQVFAQNMRDLGTPVYHKRWFANILANDQIHSFIAVVYVNSRPVSCGFMIGHGEMLEIPWASTIKAANPMNANMWMYRHILGFAIQQGYRFFDFGRSTVNAGTYRFKKQWGAKPYPHYWYYLSEDENRASDLNPDNPKYKLMIAGWKLLPVWLTKIIGPIIVADIP